MPFGRKRTTLTDYKRTSNGAFPKEETALRQSLPIASTAVSPMKNYMRMGGRYGDDWRRDWEG